MSRKAESTKMRILALGIFGYGGVADSEIVLNL